MNVFFDTEFSSLGDKLNTPCLISIGCVTQDGREFYAELADTYHPFNCSDFVVENVLPLLSGGECRMVEAELAVRLRDWIDGLTDKQVIFRSDAPGYDWPWVEQLFTFYGCWPKNLQQKVGAISFDNDNQQNSFESALADYWSEHSARQHHALVDARSLLFAWKHAIRRGV